MNKLLATLIATLFVGVASAQTPAPVAPATPAVAKAEAKADKSVTAAVKSEAKVDAKSDTKVEKAAVKAVYPPTTDQPACRLALSFSYSHAVPQRSQRYFVMVTSAPPRLSWRLPPCTSSACPGALRQLRWMPAHESHSAIFFNSLSRFGSCVMGSLSLGGAPIVGPGFPGGT